VLRWPRTSWAVKRVEKTWTGVEVSLRAAGEAQQRQPIASANEGSRDSAWARVLMGGTLVGPAPPFVQVECRHTGAALHAETGWHAAGVRRRIFARHAIKNAKSAKGAKGANPWELAPLALLGRAGNLIGAEAGGTTTGCGMGVVSGAFPRFKSAKEAKRAKGAKGAKGAKDANPRELASLPSRLGRAAPGAHLGCRNASERAKLLETSRNFSELCETS